CCTPSVRCGASGHPATSVASVTATKLCGVRGLWMSQFRDTFWSQPGASCECDLCARWARLGCGRPVDNLLGELPSGRLNDCPGSSSVNHCDFDRDVVSEVLHGALYLQR